MPASVTDFVDPKGNTHELLTLAKNEDDQWPFKFGATPGFAMYGVFMGRKNLHDPPS